MPQWQVQNIGQTRVMNDTSYLAPADEPWGDFCEYFRENGGAMKIKMFDYIWK